MLAGQNIIRIALSAVIALLGIVAVVGMGLAVAYIGDAVWLLDKEQAISVGMTRTEAVSRLGQPARRVIPESSQEAWTKGFFHSRRPVDAELLVWTFFSPTYHAYRFYVYVDAGGMVTCAFLGFT